MNLGPREKRNVGGMGDLLISGSFAFISLLFVKLEPEFGAGVSEGNGSTYSGMGIKKETREFTGAGNICDGATMFFGNGVKLK